MPNEGVWVLAGVVASGAVTIATERLRHRWQQEVRRDDQDRIRTQALADARRSAYARYLVVQHEVETLFRALPPSERDSVVQALDEHYRSRRSSPDLPVWLESAAAEMHARLLAGERVLRAIDDFEEFIRNALEARLMRQDSDLAREEWDGPWEEQRRVLIEAMRDEQQAYVADPPRYLMTLPITTARLELRSYQPEDIPRIHTVYYGDEDARHRTGGASTLAQTRAMIERYIDLQQLKGYSFWAVLERETGDIVGEAGLKPFEGGGLDVELGYAFGTVYWGRGYATEAGRAIVDEAFGSLGLMRLVAVTSDDNQSSQHVLRKLGFVPDGRRDVYGGNLLYFVRARDHGARA